jgi:hypothetical protein
MKAEFKPQNCKRKRGGGEEHGSSGRVPAWQLKVLSSNPITFPHKSLRSREGVGAGGRNEPSLVCTYE